jgi:hypothetical protein
MADTDAYQPDSAGESALADAKQKTQQAADTQKAQQQKAETSRGGGSKPAQAPASAAKPATDQSAAQKAGSAAKSAVMNSPVAQGVKAVLGSFKKGGTVPETGVYKLHEGEEVVPNNGRASEYRKVFKTRGDTGKHNWGGK